MKAHLLILIALLFVTLSSHAQRKAVFVILDGISADALEKTETPFIDEIARKGGYTRATTGGLKGSYSQSPTVSAVGYNHVLTGTWSNKHNVWDNDIADPNYHYWNIFRIAKNHNPEITTAIFSTWLDNRTKLAGDQIAEAGNIKIDIAFDGLEHDTVRYPHTADRQHILAIDEAVSREAATTIREHSPDLSWIYLEFTDDMGHRFGDGPEYFDAIRKADNQVGRIWSALKERERGFGEEWMIVVTTDHGRDSISGKHHGGQSERERTIWVATNVKPNAYFTRGISAVDIMPSILAFMQITIPDEVRMEWDGISFVGPVSIIHPSARWKNNSLHITWDVIDPNGTCSIMIASTNDFKTGGVDRYATMGSFKTGDGKAVIESLPDSNLYKVVIKAPGNSATRWVVRQ